MSIELPGWLTEPFSMIGMTWPEADEDLLNAAGDKWSRLASDLEQISHSALNAVQPVMDETKGDAAEAFDRWWKGTDGPDQRLGEDSDAARLLGTCLTGFAALTVTLKLAFIAQLAILAAEIAQAVATAFFSFGATLAEVPGFVAATRVICRQAVKKLLDHLTSVIKDIIERAKGLFKKVARRDADRAAAKGGDAAATAVSRTLSDTDRAALKDYTSEDFYEVANFLRNPSSVTDPAERAALQARADAVSDALQKVDTFEGTTYRGAGDIHQYYPEGEVVTERSFASSSHDAGVAEQFMQRGMAREGGAGTMITTIGRSGHEVTDDLSSIPGEAEVLFDKGTEFRVLHNSYDEAANVHRIVMEER